MAKQGIRNRTALRCGSDTDDRRYPLGQPTGTGHSTGTGTSPWRPLLSGALRDRALETVASLTGGLISAPGAGTHEGDPHGVSLASGTAGLAVCHAVMARIFADPDAAGLASASLDAAIDVLAVEPLSTSLYSGFPGIAWATDLVNQQLAVAGERFCPQDRDDAEDRNSGIDEALASTLRRYPDWGPYDLVDGLTGLGTYALARWPRPAAVECLSSVIERLARHARRDADGVYWWTRPSQLAGGRAQQYPDGGVDLGVAHGVAGVIPLLARAHALRLDARTVRPLLDGAVRWLLGHLIEIPSGRTVPDFVTDDPDRLPTRSAWCYGDPGVAMALLLAARDVSEPSWAQAGTELALLAAARPPEFTGVSGAGICHGAAGLAHLFNRMYQMTGEQELAHAARSWTERTLAMCEAGQPGATATGDGPGRPAPAEAGLLEGAAGVVLVLLAGCFSVEPVWDQMLLVSTYGSAEPAGGRLRRGH